MTTNPHDDSKLRFYKNQGNPEIERIARSIAVNRGRDPDELVIETGYNEDVLMPLWYRYQDSARDSLGLHRSVEELKQEISELRARLSQGDTLGSAYTSPDQYGTEDPTLHPEASTLDEEPEDSTPDSATEKRRRISLEALIHLSPNLGYETNDPSLTQLVQRYYEDHFSIGEAKALTDRYFAALIAQAELTVEIAETIADHLTNGNATYSECDEQTRVTYSTLAAALIEKHGLTTVET